MGDHAGGASRSQYHGRLELTWTNKDQALLWSEDGAYRWVPRYISPLEGVVVEPRAAVRRPRVEMGWHRAGRCAFGGEGVTHGSRAALLPPLGNRRLVW
jgi:hypothetical protein